jgi:hypothetical protein
VTEYCFANHHRMIKQMSAMKDSLIINGRTCQIVWKEQRPTVANGRQRLTNGKPALAHWIGEVETKIGQM